jgi:adenine-specific DNA methylase
MSFMEALGLRPNRLTNIWVPFVVISTHLLRTGGRLAMVLPAELLQVSYAAQLRQYLADSFQRMTIYACNEMFFEGAEQEVILLTAEGKLEQPNSRNRCNIEVIESRRVAELLQTPAQTIPKKRNLKVVQHDSEKWLKYFLNLREIAFMRSLRENPNVGTLSDHATVDVGVVTGKNEFFVLSQMEVDQFELAEYVVPLVGRSAQLAGAVICASEHRRLTADGNRVLLLHLASHNQNRFTTGLRELILEGERKGMHLGYKCRIRKPWYCVPAVWEPDCFFFRQIYDFPRVVVNRAGATSTDTIHRMRCVGPATRIAANIYTHLTAASSEIEGRSYGGGVLELEPTEAERLLVPKQLNGAMPIEDADALIRRGKLSSVLAHNDEAVLGGAIGLTASECTMLKNIWGKMRDRRMARRRV